MGLTQEQPLCWRSAGAGRMPGTAPAELTVGGRQPTNGSAGKEKVAGKRTLRRKWSQLGDRRNPKALPKDYLTAELQEVRDQT